MNSSMTAPYDLTTGKRIIALNHTLQYIFEGDRQARYLQLQILSNVVQYHTTCVSDTVQS
jgi:hypothetical protein